MRVESKSAGDSVVSANWGRAGEELPACAATTQVTLKRSISRVLTLSSPSGKSHLCLAALELSVIPPGLRNVIFHSYSFLV